MKQRHFFLISFLAMAQAFSGCAALNPFIQDFNIIPLAQEKEIGVQMSGEVAKAMTLNQDPALNKIVNDVGQRLVAQLPRKDFDYKFYVVTDPSPNAFTIPGGIIYVHTGLFQLAADPTELAGVIGHEIGHAYERHPSKSMSRTYGIEALSTVVLKSNPTKLRSMTLQLAKGGITSKYGRDDENEADEMGFYLAQRAGFGTHGLLNFMRKLEMLTKSDPTLPFLRSHPATPDRVAHLEALQKGAAGTYTSANLL